MRASRGARHGPTRCSPVRSSSSQAERSNRRRHLEPRGVRARNRIDEVEVDEGRELVDRVGRRDRSAQRLDRVEVEGSRDHRDAAQHALFAGRDQLVRPLDRAPQLVMAFGRVVEATPQHVEARRIEAAQNLRGRQRGGAGRGELDRERKPFESPAQLDDGAPRWRRAARSRNLRPRPVRSRPRRTGSRAASAASDSPGSGTGSGSSRRTCSRRSRNGAWLVTSIRKFGHRSSRSPNAGAAGSTCSKLSRTRSASSSPMRAASASATSTLGTWARPITAAISPTTISAPATPASATATDAPPGLVAEHAHHLDREPGLAHSAPPGQGHEARRSDPQRVEQLGLLHRPPEHRRGRLELERRESGGVSRCYRPVRCRGAVLHPSPDRATARCTRADWMLVILSARGSGRVRGTNGASLHRITP